MVERIGKDQSKNMYEGPMDQDNGVGIDCGTRPTLGWAEEGKWGGNWNNCNRITIFKNIRMDLKRSSFPVEIGKRMAVHLEITGTM